jgi:hypothetical protein
LLRGGLLSERISFDPILVENAANARIPPKRMQNTASEADSRIFR